MIPTGSEDSSMTNSFLNLSAFLQKVAEAVSMLHEMEFDEKLAAIEFLKAAVSNSEADLSAARATSDFVKENMAATTTTSTSGQLNNSQSPPVVDARKLAADHNAGALPNTSGIYDGGSLSCSDLIHDIMEQSGLAVDAGAVHSVKTPDKLLQGPAQTPSIRQRAPETNPDGIFHDCGEADVDVKMECVDNWSAAETIKWLPKEYNMVLVVDDDFFEDEDDVIEENKPKIESPIPAEDVAPPEHAKVDLPPNPPNPPPPPPPPEDSQVYVCVICQKFFTALDDLESHKLEHTRPHACKYCKARYTRASLLIEHERKHTGEKPIPCQHCGEMMRTKLQVTLHIRNKQCPAIGQSMLNACNEANSATRAAVPENQSKPRPSKKKKVAASVAPIDPIPPSNVQVEPAAKREYVCDECKTTFSAKETFYRHILCHKPRKYDCTICPAKFFLKSSLEVHLQAHNRKVKFGIDNI